MERKIDRGKREAEKRDKDRKKVGHIQVSVHVYSLIHEDRVKDNTEYHYFTGGAQGHDI